MFPVDVERRDVGEELEGLASLSEPIRRALYRCAAGADGVSRDDAARAVGISRSLAAYHLDKLVEAGLLEPRFERRSGRRGPGAGRPAKIYVHSRRQFEVSVPPRDYELAAQLLAEAVESAAGASARDALLDRARALGASLGGEAQQRCAGRGVVDCLRDLLVARGYEPYDEDGAVRLRNCPFHSLSARHRHLVCGMNLAVLEGVVGALGPDSIRPRLDPRTDECCVAFETPEADRHTRPEDPTGPQQEGPSVAGRGSPRGRKR